MRMISRARIASAAFAAVLAAAGVTGAALAQADQPRLLGNVVHWRALTAGPPDDIVCYATTLPEAAQAGRAAAPRPMIMVAWRPAKGTANVVTVFAAYRFKAGSEATLEFSPQLSVKLFTKGDTAWTPSPQDDATLVQIMRLAQNVVVRGVSEAGEEIADTFSLAGFTAAAARAMQACRVR